MLKARFSKYSLQFKRPSGTSRGILKTKDSWFIFLEDDEQPGVVGIGECGVLKGLSYDDREGYEEQLQAICDDPERRWDWLNDLEDWPSIAFGWEMALMDWQNGGERFFFENDFSDGYAPIPINGLIWMGDPEYMEAQIREKLKTGFQCIKMKIGAIDFEEELRLLASIRSKFSAQDVELRVDANGAFSAQEAMKKLERLAQYDLHSIEQPIKARQWEAMEKLCKNTPLPIALDEELIGMVDRHIKIEALDFIRPQYLIFKPSFIGGIMGTDEWIELAEARNIPWWMTSALESNIGLNAIAQYTASKNNSLPQGLGTGQLYTNNFHSPLKVENGHLHYNDRYEWNLDLLRP